MQSRTKTIAGLALLGLASFLTIDAQTTRLPTSKTTFTFEAGLRTEPLTLLLSGMTNNGELQTRQVRQEFNGPKLTVTYDPKKSSVPEIVQQTLAQLVEINPREWDGKQLLVFGGSLGGQVALKLFDAIAASPLSPELFFIASGTPGDETDMVMQQQARLSRLWWPGVMQNTLYNWLNCGEVYDGPHDDDSNDEVRLANHLAAKCYPLSGMSDQARALSLHKLPTDRNYEHIKFMVLRAEFDEQVLPSADMKLLRLFGGTEADNLIVVPGARHISFTEQPGLWRKYIREAQVRLGLR